MEADTPCNLSKKLRINRKKILKIRIANDCQKFNEEIQILHFDLKNEEEVGEILGFLNLDNFPNVFVITAKLNFDPESSNFLSLLRSCCKNDHEIFIQIQFKGDFKAFRMKDKLEELKSNQNYELETADQFLENLNLRITLLNNAEFEANFLNLKKAIETENLPMVKLLSLFIGEIDKNLFEIAKSTENCEIILAMLNNVTIKTSSSKTKKKDKRLQNIRSYLKREILLKIAETGNLKLLKYFQNSKIDFKTFCEMQIIASGRNYIKFSLALHKLEKNYYQSLNFDEPLRKRAKIEENQILKNFHENIKSGNLSNVQEYVKNYPHFKLCLFQGISALESAIDSKQFQIYAYLLSEGFLCDDKLRLNSKIKHLKQKFKKQIENFNLNYLKECPQKSLNILASKCVFFVNANKMSSIEAREILETVRDVEGAGVMMRILADSDVRIAMDLRNETTCTMDPHDEDAAGLAVVECQKINVAKASSSLERVVTFVHEMTHYVCSLVYENKALPYRKDDFQKQNEFDHIFQLVRKKYFKDKFGADKIIADIFESYKAKNPEDFQKAEIIQKCELIARIPEILATYQADPIKMQKALVEYSQLYEFYVTKTLRDFKIPNIYRMIKLNNNFGLLESIKNTKYQVQASGMLRMNSNRIFITTKTPKLVISKIINQIDELSSNKLDLISKNLFIDLQKPDLMHYKKEIRSLIQSLSVERVVMEINEGKAEITRIFDNFDDFYNSLNEKVQFIVVSETVENINELNFECQSEEILCENLKLESQKVLLDKKLNFQNKKISVQELFKNPKESITAEILAILCKNEEISINCEMSGENFTNFIPRTIEKKMTGYQIQEISVENFILNSRNAENFCNKILISDPAGSGKTFLFKKLSDEMKSAETNFVLFFGLKSHLRELQEGVGNSFVKFVSQMAKFDALSEEIFTQKYSKGETIIFFDAFDEISPLCKENTKRLLKLFEENGQNQIFISTRTHLEVELEHALKTQPNRIKNLTEDQQIQFLNKIWGNSKIKFAKKLVQKLTQIISSQKSIIGVPIILQGLAEFYAEKANFEDEIENLNISEIYQKITVVKFSKVLELKCGEKMAEYSRGPASYEQIHKYFAINHLFGEEMANSLGLMRHKDHWPPEEIARVGIVSFKDDFINFHHETNAEFFASLFLFEILKDVKNLSNSQVDFLLHILIDVELNLSRMFLDSMLEKVSNYDETLEIFKSNAEICQVLSENEKFLEWSADKGYFCIFEFFMHLIFKLDVVLFRKIVTNNDVIYGQSVFMRVFKLAKRADKVGKILNNIHSVSKQQSELNFEEFIMYKDRYGNNILHTLAMVGQSGEIFEIVWSKCEEFIKNPEKLREIFLEKGFLGKNLLISSVFNNNDPQMFKKVVEIAKIVCNDRLIFKNMLLESTDDKSNLITEAAIYGCEEVWKFVDQLIEEVFDSKEKRNFWKSEENSQSEARCDENGKNLPTNGELLENYSPQNLNFSTQNKEDSILCQIFEKNFTQTEIYQILNKQDKRGRNFFLKTVRCGRSIKVYEFCLEKMQIFFKDDKMREFLLKKGEFYETNALIISAENWKNENFFYFVFEKFYRKNFSKIEDFIDEKDEIYAENFFLKLAKRGTTAMLEFSLKNLKTDLSRTKFESFLSSVNKNGENFLHLLSLSKNRQDLLTFFINYIEIEFGNLKVREMLNKVDEFGSLPLHKPLNDEKIRDFEFLVTIYAKFFTKTEIGGLLNKKNKIWYENVVNNANLNCSKSDLELLREILSKYGINQ